jgi:phospholipid/cholesterol/gamma-HCH transport system substrate-binding protein
MNVQKLRKAVVLALVVGTVNACGGNPLGLVPLPGRPGVGEGSYEVHVEMRDVTNLVPNAEVKVGDVTVGTVTDIKAKDWHAQLTVGLTPDVRLPANAVARIGQKSLLGAEYLELARPTAEPPLGQLRPGDTIPLSRSDRYPETEEVLAALSVVLNGGGLGKLNTISTELNAAFGGRQEQVRELVESLRDFAESLNGQRDNIVRAIESLDALSARLNARRDSIASSLKALPAGLEVLNDQRVQLVDALAALADLGRVSEQVVDSSGNDLLANLHALAPVVDRLADSAHHIAGSLLVLPTFPWAHLAYPGAMRGDYINIHMTLDLSPHILAQNFGYGFAIPKMPFLNGLPPLGAGQGQGDPLQLPFLKDVPTVPVPPAGALAPTLETPSGPLGRGLQDGEPKPSTAGQQQTPEQDPHPPANDLLRHTLGGGR